MRVTISYPESVSLSGISKNKWPQLLILMMHREFKIVLPTFLVPGVLYPAKPSMATLVLGTLRVPHSPLT